MIAEKGRSSDASQTLVGLCPYQMAHTPLKMSIAEAQQELDYAWTSSYSPQRIAEALDSLSQKSVGWRIYHFILRICFREFIFSRWVRGLGPK